MVKAPRQPKAREATIHDGPNAPGGFFGRLLRWWEAKSVNARIVFFFCIYLVLITKMITWRHLSDDWLFGIYSLAVSVYIISRFLFSYFYEPHEEHFDPTYMPTVTFGVPAKNEGTNIRETIMRIVQSDYPADRFNVVAVNDGSTDETLEQMLLAKEEARKDYGVEVMVIDWKVNRGKRDGMAECARQSKNDIVIFIDSDSFVKPDTAKELVKYFIDKEVAAVAGHAYVANEHTNAITRMQAARYFIAFKAFKATESLFSSVTCCSGCCSAYRRSDLVGILDQWLKQSFMGVKCTYGDDRSLTNFLLDKGKKTLFSPTAISYTFVPDTFRQFMKQQQRWKKSWVRESFRAGSFIWKRHPLMAISFYLATILPLLAPVVAVRALILFPLKTGTFPFFYICGLVLITLIYGLYYRIHARGNSWIVASFAAIFYNLILMWQLPWAILTLRDSRWGTR